MTLSASETLKREKERESEREEEKGVDCSAERLLWTATNCQNVQ